MRGWIKASVRGLSILATLGLIISLPIVYLYNVHPRHVIDTTPSSPALATDDRGAVGWDRCLLNIGVDPTGAPADWRSALDTAISRYRQFGITFQYELFRTANPDESEALTASHMDVLLTWRTEAQSKVLATGAQEFPNASLTVPKPGSRKDTLLAMTDTEMGGIVGGAPNIDGAEITVNAAVESMLDVPGGPKLADVLTHELGHAIGLAHTSDPYDVMFKYADVRGSGVSFTISGRLADQMYAKCRT